MNKVKFLHIVIYLSYNCNLRCSYCVIKFNNYVIKDIVLDNIISFIISNKKRFEETFIEFIGGEPLIQSDKIEYILNKLDKDKISYQITTNGLFINKKNYKNIITKMDSINLSYNENYFLNNKEFAKISEIILEKKKINVNFIYDPRRNLKINKDNFLFIIKNGFYNINILPIVLIYEYSDNDFKILLEFIYFILKYKKILNLNFIYYIQEKNNHFEITIDPKGNILGDNMGTAEEFFNVKNKKNVVIGQIGKLDINEIYNRIGDYNYIDYLKNICESGESKQSYKNLLKLSNLLKKFNDEIFR